MHKPYRQKFCNSHLYNVKKPVLNLLDPKAKNQCGGFVTMSCQTLVIPWAVARQTLLSMGFCRQEYWSGLPFPSAEALPHPEINSGLLHCRQILYRLSYEVSQKSMYHDFIILIQPIQHSPGSSPLHHLHTFFPLHLVDLFPYFILRLSPFLFSALQLCLSCSLLLP